MRFHKSINTKESYFHEDRRWKKWFAWRPIHVKEYEIKVWFEYVYRYVDEHGHSHYKICDDFHYY